MKATVMFAVLSVPSCYKQNKLVTINYRHVLSSERAPQDEEQCKFPKKERKGHGPQRGARHQDILTD
jgi:hypothetical protein